MFSVIFDSFRDVIENVAGLVFFFLCMYLLIPLFYGGLSITAETTLSSLFINQPISWWISTLSGHIIGFFEWLFSQINPFYVLWGF